MYHARQPGKAIHVLSHTYKNKSEREDLINQVWGREDLNHNSYASVARYNYAQGQLIF
jgi:hypothetical protein